MEAKAGHRIELVERQRLTVTGVENVESFDEREIAVDTSLGPLNIKGEGLNIVQLNLEQKEMVVTGYVNSMIFLGSKGERGRRNIWQRLIR